MVPSAQCVNYSAQGNIYVVHFGECRLLLVPDFCFCLNLDHRLTRLFDCFSLDSLASTVNVSEPIIVNKSQGGEFCCSPSKLLSYIGFHVRFGITWKLQPYLDVYNSHKNGMLLLHACQGLTAVSVTVSAVAVKSGGGSDLHLQLFALGGVSWHGVAVVRPETALALSPHRLSQLIGCVRAGAPAAQTGVLLVARTHVCQSNSHVAIATDEKGDNPPRR